MDGFAEAVEGLVPPLTVLESGMEQACTVKPDEVEDCLDKLRELVEELEEDGDVVRVWSVE